MTLTRAVCLGVLAGGIALTVMGVNAYQSFGSSVSRAFTGNPSDQAVWMLVAGAVMIVAGGAGVLTGAGKRRR